MGRGRAGFYSRMLRLGLWRRRRGPSSLIALVLSAECEDRGRVGTLRFSCAAGDAVRYFGEAWVGFHGFAYCCL